jgi:hypothetical protein
MGQTMKLATRALIVFSLPALLLSLNACSTTGPIDQPAKPPITAPPANDCPTPLTNGARNGDFVTTYQEDFDKPAALGQVAQVYSDCLTGYHGYADTSDKGRYRPEQVLSVQDGSLDWYVHTDSNGQPVTAAPAPTGYTGQLYGRYTVRFRSDSIPGYKMAFLLWPDSDKWADGELDFPEGALGGIIHGNDHSVTGEPAKTPFKLNTATNTRAWHTAQITWTPKTVSFSLDGKASTTHDAAAIPTKPMHLILQVETNLSGPKPDPAVSGHVQVDAIKIEKYSP